MEIIIMSPPGEWSHSSGEQITVDNSVDSSSVKHSGSSQVSSSQDGIDIEKTKCEVEVVTQLFNQGLQHYHLRKPMYSISEIRQWLDLMDPKYMRRIILHTFHDLALDYDLGGIHLSERQRKRCFQSREQVDFLVKQLGHLQLSSSFHSLVDLQFAPKIYQYAFISPVFDSVSKPHHTAAYKRDELEQMIYSATNNIIALGGISTKTIPQCHQMGFYGVGLLGSIWKSENPLASFREVQKIVESYKESEKPSLSLVS